MLNIRIWNRDSHGLFDYHSEDVYSGKALLTGNSFFFRHNETNNQYKLVLPTVETAEDYTKILCIAYKKGRYWLYHGRDLQIQEVLKNPSDQIWMPIRSATKHNSDKRHDSYFGYKLKRGKCNTIECLRQKFNHTHR